MEAAPVGAGALLCGAADDALMSLGVALADGSAVVASSSGVTEDEAGVSARVKTKAGR